jgi:hypothetical protein
MSTEPERQVAVVAAVHSATMYTAIVFQAIGLNVQHEGVGKHGGVGYSFCFMKKGQYPSGLSDDALIVHQVREPRATISSVRILEEQHWRHFQTFAIDNDIPWRPLRESPIKRAMQLWLIYNEASEAIAEFTYRVENIEEALPKILSLMGLPATTPFPIPDISKKVNTHFPTSQLSWNDLCEIDLDLCMRIQAKARQYGYEDIP